MDYEWEPDEESDELDAVAVLKAAEEINLVDSNVDLLKANIAKRDTLEQEVKLLDRQGEDIPPKLQSALDELDVEIDDQARDVRESIEIKTDELNIDTSEWSDPEGNEDGPFGG